MQPVIFINGPPRSGKDMLGAHLLKRNPRFELVKFAKILKERTHALYGRADLPHDHFDPVKDEPSTFFLGLTPRQAYISVSERYMKPVHGEEIYGRLFIESLKDTFSFAHGYIITDSGFKSEAIPVLSHFGMQNCILVRIRDRGSFANDSRSFLNLPITTLDVSNDGDKHSFLHKVEHSLNHILQSMVGGY